MHLVIDGKHVDIPKDQNIQLMDDNGRHIAHICFSKVSREIIVTWRPRSQWRSVSWMGDEKEYAK